jgi:hypothetical protein
MISTLGCSALVVVLVEKEMSEDTLRRSWSEIRAALWMRRCCDSTLDTTGIRSDFVMGELADRKEFLFSVCRSVRLARLGESMIIASTVELLETPENR